MRGVCAIALFAWGCGGDRSPYQCSGSEQCVDHGVPGVCEPERFCSFPDPSCPGGRKFEPNAGSGLAGTCVTVDAAVPPDGPCGAVGQSCCAGASACVANGVCTGGTCQACVTAIAPGRHASCALELDHTIWCAGEDKFGQLGTGVVDAPSSRFVQVQTITDATALGSGWEFTCAVRAGGTVSCWGHNDAGQLGNNTTTDSPLPVQVSKTDNTPLTNIVELGGGYSHVCARDDAGGVWCWGTNAHGELGDGTTTQRHQAAPVLTAPAGAPITGAVALTVGGNHSCFRKSTNEVRCWGGNTQGQLGDTTLIDRPNPVMVTSAISVGAGWNNTCFVQADHTVLCSGKSWRNRIGNGANTYDAPSISHYETPVPVLVSPKGAPFGGAAEVVVGGDPCVLMQDHTVSCWGDGPYGNTGTGAGTTTPAQVLTTGGLPLTGVDHLVVRAALVCAHRTEGEVVCWGRNLEGQFGDGTVQNHGVATRLGLTCP